MKNNLTPEIRFPGFTRDWEQRKIGELMQDYVEKTTVQNQYPVLTSSQKHGIIHQEDYFADRQVTTQNNIGYFVLPRGYFTFRSRSDNDVFKFNRNDLIDKGIISYFYPVFKISNGNSDFFLNMLNSTIKKQVALEAEGTGQKVLSLKKFKNINVVIPEIQEQGRIGILLKKLDDTTTLHNKELATLKQIKQGFLQKMFPKEGESMPEVRFPGFTREWKSRKLNEVAEIIGGGTPSTEVPEYWDGDIDWYSPVEIGKETYAFSSQRKITALGLKRSSAKVLPANKTILFTSRAGIGDMAILKKAGATNQGFQSLVVNNNYDIYFVYSIGFKIKELALRHASGSTFLEISGKGLGKMDLFVPSLEEQAKIGNFFKQLDETIALYQHELDTLKETKKAFLQKMFA